VPNCRSISPEAWTHAFQSLVRYFSSRHARADAEDLAQNTLLALWIREDYEFGNVEDFLQVCFGFAHRVSKAGYRSAQRHEGVALDPSLAAAPHELGSQRSIEAIILLEEILKLGEQILDAEDWNAIIDPVVQQSKPAEPEQSSESKTEMDKATANSRRVRRHRKRRKLAEFLGWMLRCIG